MYEKFFYLTETPFNITPDPKFLYMSKKHQEAMDLLMFGIVQRKGFLMLSGEVGTGKTTICRALLEKFDSKISSALILNPLLSDIELLKSINEDFGLHVDTLTMKEQLDALNSFLIDKAKNNGNAVVIFDEAQNLSQKTLEMIRLLSNLETEKIKLIQIILVGQPELREKLELPELRQLNQRIIVRCHLESLNLEETKAYVFNRLAIAGGKGNIKFTSSALKSIYGSSAGIPRLINIICDRTLTAAFVAGKRVIDRDIEKKAADELNREGTLRKTIKKLHKKKAGGMKAAKGYLLYPAISAVIIAIVFVVWWNNRKTSDASFLAVPEIKSLPKEPANPSTAIVNTNSNLPHNNATNVSYGNLSSVENSSSAGISNNDGVGLQLAQKNDIEAIDKSLAEFKKENTITNNAGVVYDNHVIFKGLVIMLDGEKRTLVNDEVFEIVKGDKLQIIDALVDGVNSNDISVNFLGFVPNKSFNKGEDRGYLVDTAKVLWAKYSIDRRGTEYPIIIKHKDKKIGEIIIKINNNDRVKG